MRRFFENRYVLFAVLLLGLASLVLLPNALKTIDFQAGRTFGGSPRDIPAPLINLGGVVVRAAEVSFLDLLVFLVLSFIILLLISLLLDPELRRKLLRSFLRVAVSVLLIFYIIQERPDLILGILEQFKPLEPRIQNPLAPGDPAPVFSPPQESVWLSYSLALGILIGASFIIWRVARLWVFGKENRSPSKPLGQIAGIVRSSLVKLESGQDIEDFIIECYARMSSVLGSRKGLLRPSDMTPNEFSERLVMAGLPREPVRELTRLFERVRYGGERADPLDIEQARSNLNSILKFCGEQA